MRVAPVILLIALLAGCELLDAEGPALNVETEHDTFDAGQDTSFVVTLENVGDRPLYYNECLDARLEKLEGRRLIDIEHFPACLCLCVTELAPGEQETFDFAVLLAGAALPQRTRDDALYRLRFAVYTDDEMRHPLPHAALTSDRFGIVPALRAWTDASQLLLENHLDRPLAYFALEAETAQAVRLGPPSSWPHMAAGEQVILPYDSLMGYNSGDEQAVVYWSDEDELRGSLWIEID